MYKSLAQKRFFHSKAGKKAGITQADIDRYDKETGCRKLPNRVGKKHK